MGVLDFMLNIDFSWLKSLSIFRDVFKPQKEKVKFLSYAAFIIPLILAFLLAAKDANSSSMSFWGIKAMGQTNNTSQNDASNIDYSDSSNAYDGSALDNLISRSLADASSDADSASVANIITPAANWSEIEDSSLKLREDTVVLDDNNFFKWVQEIGNNPLKYQGKKIIVTGFVFKDKRFKVNEFVPARLLMDCCAEDSSPIGLLAHYDKASELEQDAWFKFTGKIVKGEFQGQETAVVNIEMVEKTDKPKNEYVYPY